MQQPSLRPISTPHLSSWFWELSSANGSSKATQQQCLINENVVLYHHLYLWKEEKLASSSHTVWKLPKYVTSLRAKRATFVLRSQRCNMRIFQWSNTVSSSKPQNLTPSRIYPSIPHVFQKKKRFFNFFLLCFQTLQNWIYDPPRNMTFFSGYTFLNSFDIF